MNCLKTITALFFVLPALAQAQQDSSVKIELSHPTKAFKFLGNYWQRNGNNYIIYVGGSNMVNLFNQYQSVYQNSDIMHYYTTDKNTSIGIRGYETNRISGFEIGYMASYDLRATLTNHINKELRMGGFYGKYESGASVQFEQTPPLGYKSKHSNYYLDYSISRISLKTDFLFNSKTVMKRLAFYTGAGVHLVLAPFQHMTVSRNTIIDSGFINSSTLLPTVISSEQFSNKPLHTSIGSGLYAVAGVKVNFSCDLNIFMEYQPEVLLTNYIGQASVTQTFGYISFGIRRKLNVMHDPEKEPRQHSPFY